jgi:hypothetical protein
MATVKDKPQSWSQLAQNIYKDLASASDEKPTHVSSSADWWPVRPRDPWRDLQQRRTK